MRIGKDFAPSAPTKGFIVFEGVNGAGKSTLIQSIAARLTEEGISVQTTREPGATPMGKILRQLVMEQGTNALSPRTELFLFAADRAHHVDTLLRPALANRTLVLCDRYYYSTLAFQGFGRGVDRSLVDSISRIAIDGVRPDLVILLDLDPETGLARIAAQKGTHAKDSFESEAREFHSRVRTGFLTLADTLPEPFLVLDATKPQAETQELALRAIQTVISCRSAN